MAKHEDKTCPRCGAPFECKVGTILQCQCNGISFSEDEKEYLRQHYTDCLCRPCLLHIKNEMHILNVQQTLHKILSAQLKK